MLNLIFVFFMQACHAETSYTLENYISYTGAARADATINPSNLVFLLPERIVAADIRGELKWKSEQNQIILRPRYAASKAVIQASGDSAEKNESDWNITDAFWESYLTSDLSLTTGLQVYQWGPAELLNPSNPLFHFNSRQKTFGYKEKGQALVRANYSLNRYDSLVFLVLPIANNEEPWIEGDFVPKFLAKYEHQFEESSSLFGVVVGREEKENTFFGGYFNWQASEAGAFYSDFKSFEKDLAYEVQAVGPFWDLAVPAQKKDWPVLAVTGIRWEGDFDVRAEYVYNSAGYAEDELKNALAAISNPFNPNYLQNLQRFSKPGLELLGKQYLYFSYRINEPIENKDLNFYLRLIYSLQDYSSQGQLEFDKAVSDAIVLFGGLTKANGTKDSEFKLLNEWQSTLGLKWVL